MAFTIKQEIANFGGKLLKLSHESISTKTTMDVNVYLPKQFFQSTSKKIPTLYYLSGLTCTPQNASEKAFWQPQADKYGFVMVFPDTSPRGEQVPTDPENSWDFGHGAGFYVNAQKDPYAKNYQMFKYVHEELPNALSSFHYFQNKIDFVKLKSITGHSMGGFGAVSGFLKLYKDFASCSAFAPILAPSLVPWGQKAFKGYLGDEEKKLWGEYDPSVLVKSVENVDDKKILVHIGSNDPFLEKQLKPELFLAACKGTSWEKSIELHIVDGFDHSYYFISTFVPEHAEFHAKALGLV
ncbi:S-formylglutathione hydrolase NDAI_0G05600 [Naumovozyma dairenensis CBS 421]|uniref:S-formylglutathione hydrolase n=1 Tax=Naumovozyma dairenensis (strain ATCC 10597 / BCRC 20456 / CBS 421 / NBRC 0211 / NRRL Y-12639) TaxID=1071378 RepID=J7SB47_NAUDC|nr:hypothetical protein NDAI_0G05600 [Naumovozyma dairenensis CBS 421]CCK73543.1 hypothetical protein NDAI_0G05600 [Naumovozyma dairenensis CBS 421]